MVVYQTEKSMSDEEEIMKFWLAVLLVVLIIAIIKANM